MWRYKLKDCKENTGFESRGIQGIILKKNEWKIVPRKIDKLERLIHLVDLQEFDEIQEARERAEQKKNASVQEFLAKEEKKIVKTEEKPFDPFVDENPKLTSLKKLGKTELIERILKADPSGYKKSDFANVNKDSLIQTLIGLENLSS